VRFKAYLQFTDTRYAVNHCFENIDTFWFFFSTQVVCVPTRLTSSFLRLNVCICASQSGHNYFLSLKQYLKWTCDNPYLFKLSMCPRSSGIIKGFYLYRYLWINGYLTEKPLIKHGLLEHLVNNNRHYENKFDPLLIYF
jgi:hypothetical protein